MMEQADRLDAALERTSHGMVDTEFEPLLDLASDVAASLQRGWLSLEDRDRLYARVLELAVSQSPWTVARRLFAEHRVSAIAGGAAVIAAGAAITVALTARHRAPAPAAA